MDVRRLCIVAMNHIVLSVLELGLGIYDHADNYPLCRYCLQQLECDMLYVV